MRALLFAFTLLCCLNTAAKEKTTTLSGVIYQKGEDFVIAETENMTPIATLQGVEFSNGNFANYHGQTVRVRGVLVTTKEGKKILRVRTLADIEKTRQQ
jgi:hypothetical protein